MLSELLRPFSFLTLQHPERRHWVVFWWAPLTVALLLVGSLFAWGINVDMFGTNGAINRVLGFVQNLPGFYIAALAAIATFESEDMQKLMPGIPPKLKVTYNAVRVEVELTRRRFLSSMFAYLTALCVMITLASIVALAVADPIKQTVPAAVHGPAKITFAFFYVAFMVQMVAITLWGLYYLGERVHTPDARA